MWVIASIRQLSIFAAHHGTLIRTLKTRDDQSSEVNNNGSSLIHVLLDRGATSFNQRSHWKAIWIFKPNMLDRSTCESPIVKSRSHQQNRWFFAIEIINRTLLCPLLLFLPCNLRRNTLSILLYTSEWVVNRNIQTVRHNVTRLYTKSDKLRFVFSHLYAYCSFFRPTVYASRCRWSLLSCRAQSIERTHNGECPPISSFRLNVVQVLPVQLERDLRIETAPRTYGLYLAFSTLDSLSIRQINDLEWLLRKKVVFRRSSSPICAHRCAISELLERLAGENVTSSKRHNAEFYWKLSSQSTTILLNPIIYTISKDIKWM